MTPFGLASHYATQSVPVDRTTTVRYGLLSEPLYDITGSRSGNRRRSHHYVPNNTDYGAGSQIVWYHCRSVASAD